jgi:large repetitive protein
MTIRTRLTSFYAELAAVMKTAKPSSRRFGAGGLSLFAMLQALPLGAYGASLELAPGVVVKFGPDAQLVVRDKLVAGSGVVFTSQKDDTAGGPLLATPQVAAQGDWRGVRLEKSAAASGSTSLADLVLRYAGAPDASGPTAALTIRGWSPGVQYVQVLDSAVGLRLLDGASPVIMGSSFLRNTIGIEASGNSSPNIASTQFSGNANYAVLNKTPATIISATGNWWGDSSGPREAGSNPLGLGDTVSTGVNFGAFLPKVPLLNPSVRLAAPATYYESRNVLLDVACVNATEFRVSESESFSGADFQPLSNGRAQVPFVTSSGDGRKAINVQFRNASGSTVTAALAGGVLIDTQPPALVIANPAANATVDTGINIELTSTDSSGVQRVELLLDDVLVKQFTSPPYSYYWDALATTQGTHQITVRAYDASNKRTEVSQRVDVKAAGNWDASRDFLVNAKNPSGVWSYGYKEKLEDPLTLFAERVVDVQTLAIRNNISAGTPAIWKNISTTDYTCCGSLRLAPGKLAIHPGPNQLSVLRWSAVAAGVYKVDVDIFAVTNATTEIWLIKQGMIVDHAFHNQNNFKLSRILDVAAGEAVDVVVGNAGNYTSDNTGVNVVVSPSQLPPDTVGPEITGASFGGVALGAGSVIARNGTVMFGAADRSGVARVELVLDGQVMARATDVGNASYTAALSIDGLANGAHTLVLRAFDSLGNVSNSTYAITVAHAVPDAPVLTQPQNGLTTRTAIQTVTGTALAGSRVQMLLNGQAVGGVLLAGADGRFSGSVTLAAGSNRLQAVASDDYGTGAVSTAIQINLDTSVPVSPSGLTAVAQAAGKVRLAWTRSTDPNAVGYDIYRSQSNFTAITEATKLTALAIAANTFDDLPPQDGSWVYRVVAVNASGTPSVPTNAAQAISDATPPKALSIVYSSLGKVDSATGRMGQGRVNVVLTTSEVLQTTPYLSIVPQASQPISVELVKTGDTTYTGNFLIDANTASGMANALFSARDMVGNRGTDVLVGATLSIDTEGPQLSNIVLTPASPIKNDTPQALKVSFIYSKAPSVSPQIKYQLSAPLRNAAQLSLSQVNSTTYTATFTLPSDAGLGSPETLIFAQQAKDDLDNVSTKVPAFNRFQVYQGNLPPLEIPFGFSAKALPGGKVKLSWQAVADVTSYQVYRQAPGQAALQQLTRVGGIEYIDQTPQDGTYKYAVASVRQANGQESVSSQAAPVEVVASATAPGAPQNLNLALTGQGIYASWQPPLASVVDYYNVYRSSGLTISTIEGLTPLKTRIKSVQTYDTNPSTTQGAYVVTAVDAAGNESAISNSAYLNASLLPVRDLKVEQLGNELPVITWVAPNGAVSGYLVYVGPESNKVKLTSNRITSTSLTDTGYSNGERRYTVASVDANGVEMPRSIVLPSVSSQVVGGLPIKRGVMNRLQVQVSNTSAVSLEGVRVVVRLPINKEATQFKDHKSEIISLSANQTRLVPVIVGGYADLPSAPQALVGVEIAAAEGELVRVVRSQQLSVIESTLVIGMATDEFTRGGSGKLKLTIENTSEVDVELLTATGNGAADSSELRFRILDADGNVLATQPYKQVFGANVVTLTSGLTVARIPAGTNYVSDTFTLNVPAASPNGIRVKLEVDKLRYHSGQEDEIQIAGRGSEKNVSLVDTAYLGEVTDVTPVSSFGDQDVVIRGRALDRVSKVSLSNTRLKLVLNQQGFERVFSVLTDGSGNFVYAFKPTVTDAGLYKVSAVHPDITDRPEQKAFTINRVTVSPTPYRIDIPKNYPFSLSYTVKAGIGTSATNLRLVLDPAAQPTGQVPAGLSLQLPGPVSLVERQSLNLPVVFSASNEAQPSGAVILSVVSDEHPTSPLGLVRIDYTLSEAKPYLTSTPSFVETGLSQGGSQMESVILKNNGQQDAMNLQFALLKADGSPAPSWASLASQAGGTLAIGQSRSIDLSFAPPASVQEGVYEFKLQVTGDNVPVQALNVYVNLTQSGQGNVLFKASDIYTATVGKDGKLIAGLANASITLQNEEVANVTRELTTDSLGEALFQNIPAGRYKFRAKASNHQEIGGRLIIKPGVTLNQPVFLNYNLITVEWSVREIAIQDRYEITLNATFETDVPAAVVVMQPPSINLPKMTAGDVYYGELTLTNYGLIRADNVRQVLPKNDGMFRYEFLAEIPSTLAAKQRLTVPYRVTSLQALDAAASSSSASGGGCYSYSNQYCTPYEYTCENGVLSTGSTCTTWFAASNGSCPSGGGSGGSWMFSGGGSGSLLGTGGKNSTIKTPGKKCVFIPSGGTSQCL